MNYVDFKTPFPYSNIVYGVCIRRSSVHSREFIAVVITQRTHSHDILQFSYTTFAFVHKVDILFYMTPWNMRTLIRGTGFYNPIKTKLIF